IAKDGARHVPADCWQMRPMVERLVAAGKPSVEPERIPLSLIRDFRTADRTSNVFVLSTLQMDPITQ
ncbi:MAG: hypothetical protein HA492_04850, partial [Candidatus Verstraetearchaeota archaeon]|nr:hypothetical protein [Candidatus Verstraetearchaeota archaeon]